MIEAIFGTQRTWQRRACISLCLVTAALGIALMVIGDDPAQGAMIAIVGIVAGVVLARMVEETTKRATTSAILGDIARMDTTTPMGSSGDGDAATSSNRVEPSSDLDGSSVERPDQG